MISGMTVSLVIPAHNEEKGLPRVLAAVPEEIDEVIVVDNASTDSTATVAASFGPRVRVVPQPVKGYGSAYMAGFRPPLARSSPQRTPTAPIPSN